MLNLALLTLVGLAPTQASNSNDYQFMADMWKRVSFENHVGKSTYRVVLGISNFDRQVTRPGSAKARSRTEVNGRKAFGMYRPWDIPFSELSEFRVWVDDFEWHIPSDLYCDIYNVRLQPMGGTSPLNGNVSVSVQWSGDILVYIRPIPEAESAIQGTASEIIWKIKKGGKSQRTIEVFFGAKSKVIHQIRAKVGHDYKAIGLIARSLKKTG